MKWTWDEFNIWSSAESRLVGSMICERDIFDALHDQIDESKFIHKQNRSIFREIKSHYENSDEIELHELIMSFNSSNESDNELVHWMLKCTANSSDRLDIAEYWLSQTLLAKNE